MSDKNILRVKKKSGYTVIDNFPIKDRKLTPGALGVLVYLLSKPDNWIVYNQEVRNRFDIGRKKLDRIMSELKTAGYVQRNTRRKDDGTFYTETIVSEVPMYLFGTSGYQADVPLSDVPLSDADLSDADLSDAGKGDSIVNPEEPNPEVVNPEVVNPEGENAPAIVDNIDEHQSSGNCFQIYKEATKIPEAKIPEKIVEWAKSWDEIGFDPALMRKAIVTADIERCIFDVDILNENYCHLDPFSWRVERVKLDYKFDGPDVVKITDVYHPETDETTPFEELPAITQERLLQHAKEYHAKKQQSQQEQENLSLAQQAADYFERESQQYQQQQQEKLAHIRTVNLSERQLLVLNFAANNPQYSQEQIAEKLELSHGIVKSELAGARARFSNEPHWRIDNSREAIRLAAKAGILDHIEEPF